MRAIVTQKIIQPLLHLRFRDPIAQGPPHQHRRPIPDKTENRLVNVRLPPHVLQHRIHRVRQVQLRINQSAVQIEYQNAHARKPPVIGSHLQHNPPQTNAISHRSNNGNNSMRRPQQCHPPYERQSPGSANPLGAPISRLAPLNLPLPLNCRCLYANRAAARLAMISDGVGSKGSGRCVPAFRDAPGSLWFLPLLLLLLLLLPLLVL